MSRIILTRINPAPTYTLGFIRHKDFFCFTLEPEKGGEVLKWEDQSGNGRDLIAQPGSAPTTKGCIPCGVYPIVWERSAKFGRFLWELKDVPNFTEIKVHNGSLAENTLGCILVGEAFDVGLELLTHSKFTLEVFSQLCHDEKITEIEIKEI